MAPFGIPEGARVLDTMPIARCDAKGANAQRRRYGPTLVLLVIAAIWLLAASRWIATDTIVPWDAKNQFYAFFRFLATAIHSGQAPFWNPYHYGGHPSVADPQSLIFSPPFVLWALFDPAPSIRAFDLIVYAHLAAGGLAVGVLGWRAGWPAAASILAAVIFMLGGPASGRLQHTGIILSYGLFPVALLLMQVALQRLSIVVAGAFGVVAAMLALGRNHEALLLCFVLAAALAAEIVAAEDKGRYLRERRGVLATMGIVAIALLAVPLLLTVQFAALSNRPEVPLDKALEASLYPANLASLAVANVLGSLETTQVYWGPNFDTLPEVGATDRSFNYLFVGAASTVVMLWFGIAGGWMARRGTRLMTAVLAVALLYALGRYTPVYALAFEYVPGVHLFRRPIDGTFVLVAAFALIAGQLLADYVREGTPRVARWRVAAVGLCALGVVGWAVAFSEKTHHGWASLWEALKVAPLAIILIVVLVRARTPNARAMAAACVAAMATAELIWFNAASSLNAEAPAYYSVLQQPAGADAQALSVLEREIADRHREGERPRIEVVGVSGSWQNLAMARGLEATNGYNPLRIGSYDRLVSPGETTHIVDQRLFPASFDGYDCALARELGLEYVVLGRPIDEVPHLARRPVSDVLMAGPKIWIYRLRRKAESRVKFVKRVSVADADAQVKAGQFRTSPAGETTQVDNDGPARREWPMSTGTEDGGARIVSWRLDRMEVEVDNKQSGILVVHEAYYPGWVAEVDGQPARILRTNVLFRGVEVGEGRHRVVFRFEPFSLSNLRDALLALFGNSP
ncbi:MAG: YfhO family protein [Alphaproteobacteria bacterium]|nr:MAG: YfhO family protein [Alphaproteobacteria bacterium]